MEDESLGRRQRGGDGGRAELEPRQRPHEDEMGWRVGGRDV